LLNASKKTGGVLKNKLTDVANVFTAYEQYLQDNGLEDQSSMLDHLPQVFLDNPDISKADVFLVGFTSFTKQTRQAIKTLLGKAKSVTAVLVEGDNTYAYLNETVEMFKNLLGKEVTVSIIGYGNDGNNEGFFVEILTKNIPYLGADRPHITLSVSAVGKAVNTAFVPMSTTADGKVTGRIGFFTNDGKIIFK
jgi:hypothetical protein